MRVSVAKWLLIHYTIQLATVNILTEEELFVCSFRQLHALSCPWVQDDGLDIGRVLEVVPAETSSSPVLLVLHVSHKLVLASQPRHVVFLFLYIYIE